MLTRTEVVFHGKGIGRCRLSWNRGKPMRDVELKGISVKSKVNNNAEPLVTGYGVRYKNQNKSIHKIICNDRPIAFFFIKQKQKHVNSIY